MTKKSVSILAWIVMFCFAYAENQTSNEVRVTVKGIEGTKGQIAIGLYDKKESWGEEPLMGSYVKILADTVTYIFKNLPQERVAIAIYHDANMNEKLDKGLFKIPKEGYAFSNNVFGTFGPPKFQEASFLLNGEKKINITLKY